MPRKSNENRQRVWELLLDGKWHSGLELVEVGGMRAPARVHELRHEESRRILCRVVDSKSAYRYVCDCGPLPEGLSAFDAKTCPACRAAMAELRDAMGYDGDPVVEERKPELAPAGQLPLFKGAA